MPKSSIDIDAQLIDRCRAILLQRAKDGIGPVDALNLSHLLGATSAECFRACSAIPGVIIERSGVNSTLDRFSVRNVSHV